MKWLFALVCVLFIGADYEKSIVRFRQTTPTGYGWQTGFAIAHEPNGATIIATSNHFRREQSLHLDVAYIGGTSNAELIHGEMSADIALLRIRETLPLLKINEDFKNGDSVHVVGHPGGSKIQHYTNGTIIARDKFYQTTGERIILSSPEIHSGFSGAPLLNDEGEVIALAFGSDYEGAHSVNIKHVKEMILRYCVNGCTYYVEPARVYATPRVQQRAPPQTFVTNEQKPASKPQLPKPDPRIVEILKRFDEIDKNLRDLDEIADRLLALEARPQLEPNVLVSSIIAQVVNHPNLQPIEPKGVTDAQLKWLIQPLQNQLNQIKEKINKPYFVSVEQ